MDELREKVIQRILVEARENGAGSPVDYGDAEQIAKAVLDIPEIKDALAEKADADEAVRGGGYYLRGKQNFERLEKVSLSERSGNID